MSYLNITKTVLNLMNAFENKNMTGKEKKNLVLNEMKIILGEKIYIYYE